MQVTLRAGMLTAKLTVRETKTLSEAIKICNLIGTLQPIDEKLKIAAEQGSKATADLLLLTKHNGDLDRQNLLPFAETKE